MQDALPKCERYFQPHVLVIHSAAITASSVWLDNPEVWGAQFAIDGIYSEKGQFLFRSSRQDYPWLQWHLGSIMLVWRVRIRNRVDCCGDELAQITIRVGVDLGNMPDICGRFDGPGEENQQYDIKCQGPTPPSGKFIVIQRMEEASILQINELIVDPPAPGKKQTKGIIYKY